MKQFAGLLNELNEFNQLKQAIKNKATPISATGLSPIHRTMLVFSLAEESVEPVLLITPDEASAVKTCGDLKMLLGEDDVVYFPAREYLFRQMEGASAEFEHHRLAVLERLMKNSVKAVVASIESVCQYTVPPSRLKNSVLNLKPLQTHKIEDIIKFLSDMGYQHREQVDGICQFAVRGGILDFFPPHLVDPVRVEFWGDEIDTMATFKIETQRRVDNIEEVVITPAREVLASVDEIIKLLKEQMTMLKGKACAAAKEHITKEIDTLESGVQMLSYDKFLPLIYPELSTVLDYFSGSIVAMSDQAAIKDSYRALSTQHFADVKIMLEEGLLWSGCNQFYDDLTGVLQKACKQKLILLDSFARTAFDIPIRSLIEFRAVQLAAWSGEYSVLHEDIADYVAQKYCCVVFAGTERTAQALTGDLQKDGISADFVADVPKLIGGKVFVVEGSITAGFEFPDINLMVFSHGALVLKAKAKTAKKSGLKSISDLTVGDYVVHISHGIGIFEGIVKREIHGVTKDYIKIRYAGTDMLFVPVTQLDLVSKYIGGREEVTVKLSKLNSAEWGKTRQRVRKAVAEMADELVKLYAARMESKGYQFGEDTDWQNDFERRFPYRETDDQLRCIDEMKKDMQSTVPMDRLLCGDVGFGKTEVAIRGAFKCVVEGKQCAVLVPTTILAWQHYQTFRKRMEGFPVKIELLSRFRTPKQQEQILKELKRGEVDIIIGTHRLVQKDVIFKDLGLCIIDEEQRFGVAHKERFKELRNNVDVLTLSATPIPRTLNMAMSGIRDMSVIEEAPQDRIPVQTYVMEHDWGVIRQAITKELRRGGQVFYLHNRVDTIDRCALTLQELVPDARIVVAHGKMGEEALSRVWKQLVDNEIDILVCTTIIETGVDVSNCNTLIIEDADRLGLSQLYQIRGRVGRSSRRAYAYMTVTPGKAITDVASKRLSAIKEFTTFGSGLGIAMRDLEIRGSGSILGAQQHGHMEAVGYEMYLKMLSDAVAVSKGEAPKGGIEECLIDIPIEAHIPEYYISGLSQRIDIYKKIASIQNSDDASDLIDELVDRFGEPPKAVEGLIEVSLMRNTASQLGFKEITQKDNLISMVPENFDMQKVSVIAACPELKGRVRVNAGSQPYIAVKMRIGEQSLDIMSMALRAMQKAMENK